MGLMSSRGSLFSGFSSGHVGFRACGKIRPSYSCNILSRHGFIDDVFGRMDWVRDEHLSPFVPHFVRYIPLF